MARRAQAALAAKAAVIVCVLVSVCGAVAAGTTATASPTNCTEAPILASLVAQGKLPPVKERLPEHPAVVPPVEKIGKYGGTWKRLASTPGDLGLGSRLSYEPLMRWDRDGRKVIPGVAERMEVKDEAKTYVFHLRKGMRWSDGRPLTSADFMFAYNNLLSNDKIMPVKPQWLMVDDEFVRMEAPDAHTVILRFAKSYGMFPQALAFYSQQGTLYQPAHYLAQFLPSHVSEETLTERAKSLGFSHWTDVLAEKTNLEKNPDLPTVNPFKVEIPFPNPRCLAVRNPYYWKVDPEGRQLPYIDEIAYTTVSDPTVLNLKAQSGEVDFQIRRIDTGNYTMFMKSAAANGYRVIATPSTNVICVYLNQCSLDPVLKPILQDRRFRQALSLSINREELVDLIYTGLALSSNGVVTEHDPYYVEGIEKSNTRYDPAEANRLLDEVGLRRGDGGMRRLPNGKPFTEILHIYPSEEGSNPEMWQLVCDYWREAGLNFVAKHEDASLSVLQVQAGSSDFWAYTSAGLHWAIEGFWKAPTDIVSYMAPAYGRYVRSKGRTGEKPNDEMQRLVDWYKELRATPDETRRIELGRSILRQWEEQCYVVGICRTQILAIVSNRFRNVPSQVLYDYRLKGPGYIGIEQFYIDGSAAK